MFPQEAWTEYNLAGFACPAGERANASVAARNPTWRYRFFAVFPDVNISSEGGACHGIEINLLFGTTDLTPSANATAGEVVFEGYLRGAWEAFARDPMGDWSGFEWPVCDPSKATLVRLGLDNLVGSHLSKPVLCDEGCATANLTALKISFGICS